ncbi:MAG: repeat-like domain, partial [Actinomycetota bacterium]|nr:repeat-like domain [Actinomycetota bacterium]
MHNRVIGIGVSVVLVAALFGAAGSSGAAPAGPVVKTAVVGPQSGGGEPSLAIALDGSEYATWPAGTGTPLYRSTDNGKTWTAAAFADTQSGDDSVNVDQSGAVYLGNLNGAETNPNALQASVYKSTDGGKTWPQHGTSLGGDNASSMPFLVDRPWTDAWIPAQKTTKDALVYVQYHDFGPGVVWVNSSTDGGKTFGNPVNVINSPTAIADSACNAMPGGVKVVQSGPHAGRVYVSWLAADDAQNGATGCNETQLAGFHTMWAAWSDDGGQTWTDQLVYDGGIGRDGSEFWPDITLDNKGNPYVAFAMNIGSEFDIWISASFDGGKT